MTRILECVPNFSEGRDKSVIDAIAASIRDVDGVRLLNVDPGEATNRTVMTFVGEPEAVIEAAFRAIRTAGELIDMSKHTGEHPRMGATDVCPLIPVSGVTREEAVEWSRKLAERVGQELALPVFLYEHSQPDRSRSNLATIRSGEYEGLADKIVRPEWKPDFGPATFDARRGATVIGAREFLVAYNVNLNTTSTRRAFAIAFDIREAGRTIKGADGREQVQPGTLKAVKAIGWYIEEYGIAQVSINLTDLAVTPVHVAFEECVRAAAERGVRVTGSELVGLIPLDSLLEAGRHFLRKQQRSVGVSERELVKIAVRSLGLDELAPFDPEQRVIEYLLRDQSAERLAGLTVSDFTHETASESPAPGGGSVAALMGALAAALGTMVANLSSHRRGWDSRWEEFSDHAVTGQQHLNRLLELVDRDTSAFDAVMEAFRMPRGSEAEKSARSTAIRDATREATRVPFEVMEETLTTMELIGSMARIGQESSVSDAGVAALAARSAVLGAWLNVRINAAQLKDDPVAADLMKRGAEMAERARELESEILRVVDERL